MAKKGKAKLSKVKRNNQTTNKMKKQGKLRLQRHRAKPQKQNQSQKPQVEYSSESEASADEWTDMLDQDEQDYILSRLAKQPTLLSNIPEEEKAHKSAKKRKKVDKGGKIRKNKPHGSDSGAESDASDDHIEDKYEAEMSEQPAKRMRPLLPIKTKDGLIPRAEECDDSESEEDAEKPKEHATQHTEQQEDDANNSDSGMEGTEEDVPLNDDDPEKVVTAVELLKARRDKLQNDKLRIGALCSSLLEAPDKKLKNLYPVLYLMEERLKDGTLNLHSVRKIATLSAFEVFKDILPEYQIRHQDYSNVKLKKDTLALYKAEKELLEFYKRFLQRLEKAANALRQKKGDRRKLDESTISLALISLRCMAGMLVARPNFNFATNIAQSVVPFLASRERRARDIVTQCAVDVFTEDKKGEVTLTIVRLINQLVKRRGERLNPAALKCLLSLKIRDVDLDTESELKHKKKQEEKHKKRIINLSKREKKRAKKLKEVEKELLETEARESDEARKKLVTEVTKTVFHIYFRLLKAAPQSRLLFAVLDGLAKFTHVINLEYYTDLVAHLSRIMSSEASTVRCKLRCARAVLSVLSGAGDALNADPRLAHNQLYSNMLLAATEGTDEDIKVVVEALGHVCARARRVSGAVLQALAKRAAAWALQLPAHGGLAGLLLLHRLATQSVQVVSLFETEVEAAGSGRFDPAGDSPEHANSHAARLYELHALGAHYHPAVRAAARGLVGAARTLPLELNKISPTQALVQYDGSQMAFKPAVPPPRRQGAGRQGAGRQGAAPRAAPSHSWSQTDLKDLCDKVENNVSLNNVKIFSER